MSREVLLLVLLVCFTLVQGFSKPETLTRPLEDVDDPGDPLFLTPFIESGYLKEGRRESKVKPELGGITSFSGFLTVNKTCGSNLFFWFFQAQNNWETAPVLLWLQGSGEPSTYGLFKELGPFEAYCSGLHNRKYSWNVYNNLLFIDQPVGTGYSFTNNIDCDPKTEEEVANDLYSALVQFFTLFPYLQKNKFFVSGQGGPGQYVPAIGYKIHASNPTAHVKINLSGMIIGNGLVDYSTQVDYSDYFYQLGLIDDNQRKCFYQAQNKFKEELKNGDYETAYNTYVSIFNNLYFDFVGIQVDLENYIPHKLDCDNYWMTFIQSDDTRSAIHVGSLDFDTGYNMNTKEYFRSVKPWIESLLEHYDILFYSGQLDIVCGYPMTVNFLRSLTWSGESLYKNATRYKWKIGHELAGYVKTAGHLREVMVRGAGRMVPSDQPKWAFNLINIATGVINQTFN